MTEHPHTSERSAGPRRADDREARWFGFRPVEPAEKPSLVRGVFASVAGRYDLMNDLMSGGVHRLWKSELVDLVRPRPGMTLLDVAGGTGDIAMRVLGRAERRAEPLPGEPGRPGPPLRVIVCDVSEEMVEVGRDRAVDRGILAGIEWVVGDAERLPVADRSVDGYVIAFGLRNVTHIDAALAEARRVLKTGGRFLCLEFSRVVVPVLRELYDRYSFVVLPRLGGLVAGDREAYQYLVESIRQFPDQEALAGRLAAAGLGAVHYRNLTGGVAAIHSAWRI